MIDYMEFQLITIPLILIFIPILLYEVIREGISNIILAGIALYLFVVVPFCGHLPLSNHLLSMGAIFLLLNVHNRLLGKLFHRDPPIGITGIKLFSLLAFAMGVQASLLCCVVFAVVTTFFGIIGKVTGLRADPVPATPIIFFSIVVTYLWRARDFIIEWI